MSKDEMIPVVAVELMGALMERSLADSQFITDQLLDAYREERDEERARVAAIRAQVERLFAGPHQPSQWAVMAALHPSAAMIDAHREPGS